MPSRNLERRLLGLCIAAGLVVAIVPSAIDLVLSERALEDRARAHANELARSLQTLATRQPRLWRYNAGKVARSAIQHPGVVELARLQVFDCHQKPLFSGEKLGLPQTGTPGPIARAPITQHGKVAGFIEVAVAADQSRKELLWVALVMVLMGTALGGGLYLVPARRIAAIEVEERRRKTAERVIESQEAERRRIAADLHDGLGQHLSAARVAIELGRKESALESTDDALTELRHAVFHLRPRELDEAGLRVALQAAVERFELRTGVTTALRISGGEVTNTAIAATLLRIVQEALSNVARHAAASEALVELRVDTETVSLLVKDDGRGFDVGSVTRGAGLDGMLERARLHGGQVLVQSGEDGTVVTAELALSG